MRSQQHETVAASRHHAEEVRTADGGNRLVESLLAGTGEAEPLEFAAKEVPCRRPAPGAGVAWQELGRAQRLDHLTHPLCHITHLPLLMSCTIHPPTAMRQVVTSRRLG